MQNKKKAFNVEKEVEELLSLIQFHAMRMEELENRIAAVEEEQTEIRGAMEFIAHIFGHSWKGQLHTNGKPN